MPATDQKYSQYVDSEGRVIKRPEGPGWSDPFGDDVWRSSWFYASLLVIKGKDSTEYDALKSIHGLDDALPEQFLQFFESHCTGADAWSLPKNPSQKFSGDQLAPLLYLFASTHLFGSDAGKSAAQRVRSPWCADLGGVFQVLRREFRWTAQ